MRTADHVVDIGPGAGVHGGYIVAEGTPEDICANPNSITGKYLTGELKIDIPEQRHPIDPDKMFKLFGAEGNNLKKVDVEIPAGLLALDLLQNVSLDFMLDDVEVESIEDPALLNLSALGIPLLGGGELVALSAPATTAFDAVQLNATAGVASLLSNVNVFGGCGEYVETGSAAAR